MGGWLSAVTNDESDDYDEGEQNDGNTGDQPTHRRGL
jgi:hypothetical protein